MRGLKKEQWLRIAWINAVLNEDQENAGNGMHKGSVRKETIVVSGMIENYRAKSTPKFA